MASEATMKSSPLETIKVIPFWEMTRRRAGDAFAIIEAEETANDMWKALKSRYDSKKTKDLVKATTQLEKCYMKNDMEDPHMWILELERLNRELVSAKMGP
ncbi:hypothetical protein MHU86_13327 [Fragilaria crotonensis]|nr:hypothetical protein MHU86_13327 [Fragilaria crotonensis]